MQSGFVFFNLSRLPFGMGAAYRPPFMRAWRAYEGLDRFSLYRPGVTPTTRLNMRMKL